MKEKIDRNVEKFYEKKFKIKQQSWGGQSQSKQAGSAGGWGSGGGGWGGQTNTYDKHQNIYYKSWDTGKNKGKKNNNFT